MEHQDQSGGTILDISGRCQPRMFTAPPLWLCRGLQGKLLVPSNWTPMQHTLQMCRGLHKQWQQGNQRWQIPRPATFHCLATFPPLKSNIISLLARVFIFLIDRATQEVAKKIFERNCRSSCWYIHNWIVRLAAYWRGMTSCTYVTLHLYTEYIDLPGVCIQQFVMINWILQ